MNIIESVIIAFNSIRTNKLRAGLTLLSISIGVFAIISSGSLVDSLNNTVTGELASLGENTFSIYKMPKIQMGHATWQKYRKRKPIIYSQYDEFKKRMTTTHIINATSSSSGNTLQWNKNETDPDVRLIGSDEHIFDINNRTIVLGRGITSYDIDFNRNVAVIGNDIVVQLFPNVDPIGKFIRIKNHKYEVIGVLKEQGAVLGESQDNLAIVPLTHFLKYFASYWEESLQIDVKAANNTALFETMDEAISVMRSIREVKPWQENSFELETNESLSEQFSDFTNYLAFFGAFCGMIALIAAGVGIMNIMLVSVNERTREIGIRKAVGAKKRWIMYQFIIETITLCQVGGAIGILMGILGGSLLGSTAGFDVVVPVQWIIISVIICTFLGLIFGAYPAWKAAKLDPIEALRYE